MKRALNSDEEDPNVDDDERMKKKKSDDDDNEEEEEEEETGGGGGGGVVHDLGDDLLFEVLKHFDARSLGVASCVNKRWYKISQDERIWELICTRHWANVGNGCANIGSGGCENQQLRSVVLVLGGFRRLHSLYIWPLFKHNNPSPSTSIRSETPSRIVTEIPSRIVTKTTPSWAKDEVHLSLSLLSIRFYETMNPNKRR